MQTRLRIYLVIFFLPEWSVYIGDLYFAGILFIKLSLTIDLFVFSSSYLSISWSSQCSVYISECYRSLFRYHWSFRCPSLSLIILFFFLWTPLSLSRSLPPSLYIYIYLYLSINNILYLIVSFVKCWNNNESWSSEVHAAHTSIYLGRSKDDLNSWNDCWFRACEKQIIEKGCPRIEIQEAKKLFSQETQREKRPLWAEM